MLVNIKITKECILSRKILVVALALFVSMAIGAFAQSSLRAGIYQTQGLSDTFEIRPNARISSQGNFVAGRGTYGILARQGGNIVFGGEGTIVGDEFRFTIQFVAPGVNLSVGTLGIVTITNNETFVDVQGLRWIWMRAR